MGNKQSSKTNEQIIKEVIESYNSHIEYILDFHKVENNKDMVDANVLANPEENETIGENLCQIYNVLIIMKNRDPDNYPEVREYITRHINDIKNFKKISYNDETYQSINKKIFEIFTQYNESVDGEKGQQIAN